MKKSILISKTKLQHELIYSYPPKKDSQSKGDKIYVYLCDDDSTQQNYINIKNNLKHDSKDPMFYYDKELFNTSKYEEDYVVILLYFYYKDDYQENYKDIILFLMNLMPHLKKDKDNDNNTYIFNPFFDKKIWADFFIWLHKIEPSLLYSFYLDRFCNFQKSENKMQFIESIGYRLPSLYFSPYFLKHFPNEQYVIIKNFTENIIKQVNVNNYFVFRSSELAENGLNKSDILKCVRKRVHYSSYVDIQLIKDFYDMIKRHYPIDPNSNINNDVHKLLDINGFANSLQFDEKSSDYIDDEGSIMQISPKMPQTLFSAFPLAISISSPQDEFNYRHMNIAQRFQIIVAKNTMVDEQINEIIRTYRLSHSFYERIRHILYKEEHDPSELIAYKESDLFKYMMKRHVNRRDSKAPFKKPLFVLFGFVFAYEDKYVLSMASFAKNFAPKNEKTNQIDLAKSTSLNFAANIEKDISKSQLPIKIDLNPNVSNSNESNSNVSNSSESNLNVSNSSESNLNEANSNEAKKKKGKKIQVKKKRGKKPPSPSNNGGNTSNKERETKTTFDPAQTNQNIPISNSINYSKSVDDMHRKNSRLSFPKFGFEFDFGFELDIQYFILSPLASFINNIIWRFISDQFKFNSKDEMLDIDYICNKILEDKRRVDVEMKDSKIALVNNIGMALFGMISTALEIFQDPINDSNSDLQQDLMSVLQILPVDHLILIYTLFLVEKKPIKLDIIVKFIEGLSESNVKMLINLYLFQKSVEKSKNADKNKNDDKKDVVKTFIAPPPELKIFYNEFVLIVSQAIK